MWFSEFLKNVLSLCFGFEFLFYVWELKRMLCVRFCFLMGYIKWAMDGYSRGNVASVNKWLLKDSCWFLALLKYA
jgi:hypothetical protein